MVVPSAVTQSTFVLGGCNEEKLMSALYCSLAAGGMLKWWCWAEDRPSGHIYAEMAEGDFISEREHCTNWKASSGSSSAPLQCWPYFYHRAILLVFSLFSPAACCIINLSRAELFLLVKCFECDDSWCCTIEPFYSASLLSVYFNLFSFIEYY